MAKSLAESLALLPEPARQKALNQIQSLSNTDAEALLYDWRFWGRPEQLAPDGEWFVWLILAGRGWGKTRTGAEWVIERAASGKYRHIALIGETAADVRDVMVESGPSSILKVSPPWYTPRYEPSKRRLTWPRIGPPKLNLRRAFCGPAPASATCYSGEEPDQLRGPNHDTVWADEPAKWRYADEAWMHLEMGLRIGPNPRVVATTTPKPTPLIRALVKDSGVHVTGGSTFDNITNLHQKFIDRVVKRYEGTRLGSQELYAVLLEDTPGALWTQVKIDETRRKTHPELVRVVIGIDPAASSGEDSDETGIVVAGMSADGHGYVLQDYSLHGTPREWAMKVYDAYVKHSADCIVAEKNNGGEMVEHTLRTLRDDDDRPIGLSLPIKLVWASRGKRTRAEPIALLYEQSRVHHVGQLAALESQLTTWVPDADASPDRMDAMVWALTELLVPSDEPKRTAPVTIARARTR